MSVVLEQLDLSDPAQVMDRLAAIERDLAIRQNALEAVARQWYDAKRDVEKEKAMALLKSEKQSITEKKADAELAGYLVPGASSEAEYEALKSAIRVLETRASVCMSLLKAQGRLG